MQQRVGWATRTSCHAIAVKKAARAYRVYFHKTNEEKGDYLVDHSIIMYMIDPNGDFLTFFGRASATQPSLALL